MNKWLREPKNLFLACFATIALLASLSQCVSAATLKYQSAGGWMFDYQGTELFCRTEGDGRVTCIDVNQAQYQCTYQDPPEYFKDCLRVE